MNYQSRNLIIPGENSQVGNLWLGDYESARNKRSLRADGINAVVTAGLGMKISYTNEFTHKLLPLYDCEAEDIARFFDSSYAFVDDGLKNGNVLIHCYAGVSRSVTILAAFLIKKKGWSFKETFALIKKNRPCVGPNKGFLRQLRFFQAKINNLPESEKTMDQKVMIGKEKDYLMKVRTQGRQSFVQGVLGFDRREDRDDRKDDKADRREDRGSSMAGKQILGQGGKQMLGQEGKQMLGQGAKERATCYRSRTSAKVSEACQKGVK